MCKFSLFLSVVFDIIIPSILLFNNISLICVACSSEISGEILTIIGVGGVDSGKSAYNKFLSGANFVQLYTGMIYQGPNIVVKIKKELKELLINKGVSNFQNIIGKKEN